MAEFKDLIAYFCEYDFLKYTKYSCVFAPCSGAKSLANRSCQFNQRFLKGGIL